MQQAGLSRGHMPQQVAPIVSLPVDRPGCLSCRMRRIKCDGGRPDCAACEKGAFECLWPGQVLETDAVIGHAGRKRQRLRTRERSRQACGPCRSRKIRCAGPSTDGGNSPCPRCERLSIKCSWERAERGTTGTDDGSPQDDDGAQATAQLPTPLVVPLAEESRTFMDAVAPALPLESVLGNKIELHRLIRLYFGTVHYYGFLTFIHAPSFFKLLDTGRAPRELTAMMLACALRFASEGAPGSIERADCIFDESFPAIRDQLYEGYGAIELMAGTPLVEEHGQSLRTIILAHKYEHSRGNFSSSWILWGNAVRIMYFLSLHVFDETYATPRRLHLNPLLKAEALRRLAWSTFYLDTMGDAGRHGVHGVTLSGYHVQLPSDEMAFIKGEDVVTGPLDPSLPSATASPAASFGGSASAHHEGPTTLGISAHLIRTAAMRRKILHYNSRIKYSTEPPSKMLQDIASLEVQLKACIADLPPKLAYSEENLFLYTDQLTAFILLHMTRHNCFIMLAWAKLNSCARDPRLRDSSRKFLSDKIRHALPVSRIVADALRLGVNCDPIAGVQAYTCLEILLLDTIHLGDPSLHPTEPRIVTALKVLLELIRKLVPVDAGMRHLRIEACRRVIRRDLGSRILSQADWDACRSDSLASGDDETEFDFRVFRWHRYENRSRHRSMQPASSRKTPWAVEALLDLAASVPSRAVSRAGSPRVDHRSAPEPIDAGAVLYDADPAGLTSFMPSMTDASGFDYPSILAAGGLSVPTGPANAAIAVPLPPPPQLTAALLLEQRRWFDLDYGWGERQDPGSTTRGNGGPEADYVSTAGLPSVGDDFSRFLEQAGYPVTDETDPFSWTSLAQ